MIAPAIVLVVLIAMAAWLQILIEGIEVRQSARERGLYDE